ncbi:MAG: hypothetical protein ACKVVP_04345, partial [Chloroflexota bacterium]
LTGRSRRATGQHWYHQIPFSSHFRTQIRPDLGLADAVWSNFAAISRLRAVQRLFPSQNSPSRDDFGCEIVMKMEFGGTSGPASRPY